MPTDLLEIVRFIFELGQLRRETRHGWLRIHEAPESVAEHTHRAACLGYLLARMEGLENPCRVATMILFHDMQEARTGDADRVQKCYATRDEEGAARHQTQALGPSGEAIFQMWQEVETQSTLAGQIAKDAEILEMAFTARELVVRGNRDAQAWIDSVAQRLTTRTAQRLLPIVQTADPSEWWKRIWSGNPAADTLDQ